jgi:acetylornithine deacetylase/succinyl-diaminopimelate desuccinylase-like protein
VTPILTPGGGTDSPYFRRLGARCYGCAPIMATTSQITSIHGDDEYITPEQLVAGSRVVEAAVRQAATQ